VNIPDMAQNTKPEIPKAHHASLAVSTAPPEVVDDRFDPWLQWSVGTSGGIFTKAFCDFF